MNFEYTTNYVKKLITPNIATKKKRIIKSLISCGFFLFICFLLMINSEIKYIFVLFAIYTICVFIKNCCDLARLNIIKSIYDEIYLHGYREFAQLEKKFSLSEKSIRAIVMMGISAFELRGFHFYGNAVISDFYKKQADKEEKEVKITFIKCSNCGASLSVKDNECPYCGTKLK